MVRIAPPPPGHRRVVSPVHAVLPVGAWLHRIFDPASPHRPGPVTFRHVGPLARFDQHEGTGAHEPRGVYYAGLTLDCAVVEAFDIGVVQPGTKHLARVRAARDLTLLDLRGRAAMRAGTVAAIAGADHKLSQQWGRYVYETPEVYGLVDGILYPSAHNGDDAVALFERAADALDCPAGHDAPLTDPDVLAAVRRVALGHGLLVLPP